MMSETNRSLRIAMAVGLLGFVCLAAAAMWMYPGGNWFDPKAAHHHFWHNFLCDVMDARAVNGKPNGLASHLMISAVATLYFLGLLPLWWWVSALVLPRPMGWLVRGLGLASVVGIFLVLASGLGGLKMSHATAILCAAIPGLSATLLTAGALHLSRHTSLWLSCLGLAMLLAAAFDTVVYLQVVWYRHPLTPIVPIMQRVVVLLLLAWLARLVVELKQLESGSKERA